MPGALALVVGSAIAAAGSTPQDVARGRQAARENQLVPGHAEFYRQATHESHQLLDPLLEPCALQDCFGAGVSNTYVVRVQADGSFGEVYVEPDNRFTSCLARGLKTGRLRTPPPSDNYWIEWAVAGTMRVPEGCREELIPPAWHSLKWWLFLADMAFPGAASRMRVLLCGLAILPFLLALSAWKLLRPDDGRRELLPNLALGLGLVALAALASFAIGFLAGETPDDRRENAIVTVLMAFPLLSALPLTLRGLKGPRLPRGSRVRVPTPGPVRRSIGILLLSAALLPAAAMAWFAAHENLHRACETCVKPYKLRWLGL